MSPVRGPHVRCRSASVTGFSYRRRESARWMESPWTCFDDSWSRESPRRREDVDASERVVDVIQPWPALAPSVTVTRFAITVWAAKLRFDAFGRDVPYGYTVSRLDAEPLTSVTLSTPALALAGIGEFAPPRDLQRSDCSGAERAAGCGCRGPVRAERRAVGETDVRVRQRCVVPETIRCHHEVGPP